jgi:superfamily II DNA or RNA helicase
MRRTQMAKFLSRFELVIAEEAHEAGGESYYEVMNHCKSAVYRLALTATPFMKEDREPNMRLMACSGSIGIQVSEKQLIDNGILATPHFKYIKSAPPPVVIASTKWPTCYNRGITGNDTRNDQIVYEAKRFRDHGLSTMILVLRRAHGKELATRLRDQGVKARFIWGETDQEVRDFALAQLQNGELEVLIGSNILDVGVDVPALGALILAGGMKEEVGLRQRIGRALRAKKTGGNVTFIVDFDDIRNRILKRQSSLRRSIVENTPGFAENVLSDGEDFNFELLKAA